jgi:hypothetical protein
VNGPRSSPKAGRGAASPGLASQIVLAGVLAAAVVLAAQVGRLLLLLVVAAATGIGAVELGTDFGEQRLATSPLLYLAGAVAFPICAYLWREPGLSAAAAAVVFMAAVRFVLARPERGALLSIAAYVLASLYLGFGGSFVVLLDGRGHGPGMVAGLVLITVLFHLGRFAGDRIGTRWLAPHLPAAPSVQGVVVGFAGAFAGGVGFLDLAKDQLRLLPVIQIGLASGAALTVGTIAWALIRSDRPPVDRSPVPGQILAIAAGALIAAPVLYYAGRLASV